MLFQSFVKCNLVITPVRLKHQLRQHPFFSRFFLFSLMWSPLYPFHSKTQPKLKFNKILKFHFIKCWKTKSATWKRFHLKGPQTQTLESLYKKTYMHGRFIKTCQPHKCPFSSKLAVCKKNFAWASTSSLRILQNYDGNTPSNMKFSWQLALVRNWWPTYIWFEESEDNLLPRQFLLRRILPWNVW